MYWLHQVFFGAHGLSLAAVSRVYSSWWCTGFSLWWPLLLWNMASEVAAHRLSSCGVRACGIFLGPGIKLMSPALAGRFLTNGPPGKSSKIQVFFPLYIMSYPHKWWQIETPAATPAQICILLHLSSCLGAVLWRLWWRWIFFWNFLSSRSVPFSLLSCIFLLPCSPTLHSFSPNPYAPTTPVCLTGHVLS